jgi:Protein of unknown function (DUF433)
MTGRAVVVHSDPEILVGTPGFVGTRVPLRNLFDYLEGGHYLDEFLDAFSSCRPEQHARGSPSIEATEIRHHPNLLAAVPTRVHRHGPESGAHAQSVILAKTCGRKTAKAMTLA